MTKLTVSALAVAAFVGATTMVHAQQTDENVEAILSTQSLAGSGPVAAAGSIGSLGPVLGAAIVAALAAAAGGGDSGSQTTN